jgi:hypothetical protein
MNDNIIFSFINIMGLGEKKIIRSINTLGRKASNTVNKIGVKADGAFNKVENTIGRVDNVAENAINKTANLGQKIVNQSGQVTNGLRAGSNIANAVAQNLNALGIPGANLASGATRQLARGADQLDRKRDKLANQIENARNSADLEKSNLRKRILNQNEKARNEFSSFV